ncbi:MAG: TetR/AcrR family transcriptional regulator [Deltaproteobacteria bacterium]|nr:TetR/AcrR family transcriptional regulator [Deltaproteobacteria bacterium]
MNKKKTDRKNPKKVKKHNPQKKLNIIEGALKVFGEKGYEETTISAISKAANISDATVYEYFSSKEDVLFSISELYTARENERISSISHYIHSPREKIRVIIQAYLEFYENNRLYTSVALLLLKGNRNFIKSEAYKPVKRSASSIVEAFNEGVEKGLFRDNLDPYIVRNMVLGFIEHLTIQWLLLNRPQNLSEQRDMIFDMVIRAIEKEKKPQSITIDSGSMDITFKEE